MHLGRIAATVAASAIVATPLAVAGPAAAVTHFANCTAMHKVYKHGVAKSQAAAIYQVKKGYGKPKVSKKLYDANSSMDADKDGTACEA